MKKLKKYWINDGLDGIILAKSLKQAMKILAPYYCYTTSYFLEEIKKEDGDFKATDITHVAKKGINRKPRMMGWCE